MDKCKYPHLFSPIEIGGKRLRNRVVASAHDAPNAMVSAGNGYDDASVNLANYMGMLARGGAAIVNTGHYGVDPRFRLGGETLAIDLFSEYELHRHQIPAFHLCSDLVHSYGALASFELNHGGHYCTPFEGNKVLGPMDGEMPDGRIIVGMDEAEMDRVIEMYVRAAEVAKRSGFDIINVHAAHNWLLGEFFSPVYNKRQDEYGGSVENRARFPLKVLKAIREEVGKDMLISVRYSVAECVEGGIELEDSIKTVDLIADYADIVHCSAGKVHNVRASAFVFPTHFTRHGINTYLADAIKKNCKSNVIVETIGGINQPEQADELIANGSCDLVAMARSFIADNDWPRKAKDGCAEDIRPCIRCLRCLSPGILPHNGEFDCTVNPKRVLYHTLTPSEYTPKKPLKKVAVVGGGPAGMMAAKELAMEGHTVDLYEKSGKLGGRLEFADHMEFKEDIRRYRAYLIHQVEKSDKITIHMNTELTPEMAKAGNYDALVVAIGAESFTPDIPGADRPGVIHCDNLFGNEHLVGDHAVIVGGGMVGCEATIQLQSMGKKVDLVEVVDELMKGEKKFYPDERDATLYYLNHEFSLDNKNFIDPPEIDRVKIHLKTKCTKVLENGIEIEDENGNKSVIEADTVILSTGRRPNKALLNRYEGLASNVIYIGDCKQVGNLYGTTTGGVAAAREISSL